MDLHDPSLRLKDSVGKREGRPRARPIDQKEQNGTLDIPKFLGQKYHIFNISELPHGGKLREGIEDYRTTIYQLLYLNVN